MRYGRIWPSSALLLHRDAKGSKSCWRLSHRMRVRASRLPADAYASLPVTPENAARLRHGRGDDVRIMALLRRTLGKEIAVGAPRFQSRFHRRSGDHLIEETQRSLIRLQFSRHELSTARAASPRNERTARPV